MHCRFKIGFIFTFFFTLLLHFPAKVLSNGLAHGKSSSCPDRHTVLTKAPQLINLLNTNHRLYYQGKPTQLSDHQYDTIQQTVRHYNQCHPELMLWQQLKTAVHRSKNPIKKYHTEPMLSLKKAYSKQEVIAFMKALKQRFETVSWTVEPKYDGIAISVDYKNKRFFHALLKGNGIIGNDISKKIIALIPHSIKQNHMTIHGELVAKKNCISESDDMFTRALPVSYINREKNWREIRSCMLFIPYHAIEINRKEMPVAVSNTNHHWQRALAKDGFHNTVEYTRTVTTFDEVTQYYQSIRKNLHFIDLDGVVLKVKQASFREQLGSTKQHPRWSIAWKFNNKQKQVTIKRISYSISRIGRITPILHIDPVELGTKTVQRVSGHNINWLEKHHLGIGDVIKVELRGNATPVAIPIKTTKTQHKVRNIPPTPSIHPNLCLYYETGCEERFILQFQHMFSKKFDKTLLKNLIKNKYIVQVSDLFYLQRHQIESWTSSKNTEAILKHIDTIKKWPPEKLLYQFGIPLLSQKKSAQLLVNKDPERAITTLNIGDMKQTLGLSSKKEKRIWQYISDPDFKHQWSLALAQKGSK